MDLKEVAVSLIQLAREQLYYSEVVMPQGVPTYRTDDIKLSTYREMLEDPVVWSSLMIRSVATFPGYHLLPADESKEAQRVAEIVQSILDRMPGSFLSVVQEDILLEKMAMGFCVAELKQGLIPVHGRGYVGLDAIKVKPAETFEDNLVLDRFGNVQAIKQRSMGRLIEADPETVLFLQNSRGSGKDPHGRSSLKAAVNPWIGNKHTFQSWQHYLDVHGGGRNVVSMPEEYMGTWSTPVFEGFKGMVNGTTVVIPDFVKHETTEPQGQGARVYLEAWQEGCKQIRLAILGQEVVNAEGNVVSLASREAQQNLLMTVFTIQGEALAEHLSEQVVRRICMWNGLYPAPRLLLLPKADPSTNVAEILTALGDATMKGVLTVPLDPLTQVDLINQLLRQTNVEALQINREEGKWAFRRGSPKKESPVYELAAPSKARQRAEILKDRKELDKAVALTAAAFSEVWRKDVLPGIVDGIADDLFDAKGNWKSTSIAELDDAIDRRVKSKGNALRKVLDSHLEEQYHAGVRSAERQLPSGFSSAATLSYRRVTPAQALQILSRDVYRILGNHYGPLSEGLYFILRDGLRRGLSERETMGKVSTYLTEHGLEGSATTIVQTALSTAYADARMDVFRPLEDKFGKTPGSIIGYEFSNPDDADTTEVCREWNGKFFPVDSEYRVEPPLHYNCRSVIIPVFAGESPWNDGGEFNSSQDLGKLPRPAPEFGG